MSILQVSKASMYVLWNTLKIWNFSFLDKSILIFSLRALFLPFQLLISLSNILLKHYFHCPVCYFTHFFQFIFRNIEKSSRTLRKTHNNSWLKWSVRLGSQLYLNCGSRVLCFLESRLVCKTSLKTDASVRPRLCRCGLQPQPADRGCEFGEFSTTLKRRNLLRNVWKLANQNTTQTSILKLRNRI